jgi:superfamily II DNA/RNA helicase
MSLRNSYHPPLRCAVVSARVALGLRLGGGWQVVVCTPGRLIDMIKVKACSMRRTTFLVLGG